METRHSYSAGKPTERSSQQWEWILTKRLCRRARQTFRLHSNVRYLGQEHSWSSRGLDIPEAFKVHVRDKRARNAQGMIICSCLRAKSFVVLQRQAWGAVRCLRTGREFGRASRALVRRSAMRFPLLTISRGVRGGWCWKAAAGSQRRESVLPFHRQNVQWPLLVPLRVIPTLSMEFLYFRSAGCTLTDMACFGKHRRIEWIFCIVVAR